MRTLTISDPSLVASAAPHDAWAHYRSVTIDNTGGAAKTDWPVRVTVTTAYVGGGGEDLQFRAADGVTVLPHWIEDWSTTGHVWVKVPAISAGGSVTVRCYYDNPAAVDASSIASVFPAGVDFSETASITAMYGSATADEALSLWGGTTIVNLAAVNVVDATATGIREQDDITYDPVNDIHVFYFSTDFSRNIHRVTSSDDGQTWSSVALCTLDGAASFPGEDPSVTTMLTTPSQRGHIYRDGSGFMYVWYELGNTIGCAKSSDGVTFTSVGGAPGATVIGRGGSGSWEEYLTGSPCGRHDGTKFIVGYEGIAGSGTPGTEAFGIATGTNPAAMTKSAANPVWTPTSPLATSIVVDSMFLNDAGTAMYFLAHAGSGTDPSIFRGKTTNLTPSTWVSGDITLVASQTKIDAIRKDLTLDHSQGVNAVVTTYTGNSEVLRFRMSGPSNTWRISRFGSAAAEAYQQSAKVVSGTLVLTPPPSGDTGISLFTSGTPGPASNFEFLVRAKQEFRASDYEDWASMSFGTGSVAGTDESGTPTNGETAPRSGYRTWFYRPDTTGIRLEKTSSTGGRTTLGTNATLVAIDARNMNDRKLRYRADGSLYTEVGTTTRSSSDTGFLSGAKRLCVNQAQRADGKGAVQTIEHAFARPFDGVDPSTSIGTEVPT